MGVIFKLLYSIIGAIIYFVGISVIAPTFYNQPRYKHGILVVYLSAYFFVHSGTNLLHVIILYGSISLILILLYNLSAFISSTSITFLFLIHIISSLISVNMGFMLFRRAVDFRTFIFDSNMGFVILYIFVFLGLLKYYQMIMNVFKNIVSINKRIERLLFFSNFAILTAILTYQRVTFTSLVKISSSGVIEQSGTYSLSVYLFLTYVFISFILLLIIFLINRNFIVDNNLENYKYKAEIDQMTGVLSREAGICHLKAEMATCNKKKYDLTVAYVDVNDLKLVNDLHGHKEGDKLIKAISKIIQHNLREFDAIARLGGDEFIIVFSRCNAHQAKKVWQRINDEILQVNLQGTYRFKMSASVGFVQYNPVKHRNTSELMHEADEAMYLQKKQVKEKMMR